MKLHRLVMGVSAFALTLLGIVVVTPPAVAGLTACQKEFPYSVSVLTPRVVDKGYDEYWAFGRIKLWDNDMDGCEVRVCVQQRQNSSDWYAPTSCTNIVLHYEGAAEIHQSSRLIFQNCSSFGQYRDDVRTFTRNAESSVGSGRVSDRRDVCPNNGG